MTSPSPCRRWTRQRGLPGSHQTRSCPLSAAAPAYRQPISATRHDKPTAVPPASHDRPLPSPPPAQLSSGTTDDAEWWTFPGSFSGDMGSPTMDTGPCHCDAVMRTILGQQNYRSPRPGHPHDCRSAQQEQHRLTNAVKQPTISEQENNDSHTAHPDGQATPRRSPG